MKKKILNIFMFIFIIFGLSACNGETINAPSKPDISVDDSDDSNNDDKKENPDDSDDSSLDSNTEEEVTFTVSLSYLENAYIPKNEVTVTWYNAAAQYSAVMNEEGYATIKNLDDEYNVRISNLDSGYTYNPNIYKVDPDNPNVTIELLRISKPSSGKGYTLGLRYKISSVGTYSANLTKMYNTVYYQFSPTEPGVYTIESYVDTYDDTINPVLNTYIYSTQALDETINTGGKSVSGGYTKNFMHLWKLSEDNFSSSGGGSVSFLFGVTASNKLEETTMSVVFEIKYYSDYFVEKDVAELVDAKELDGVTPTETGTFINADGGTGSYYYSGKTNGTGLLDASKVAYNEETGFWCLYDSKTGEFGATLCAYVSSACPFMDVGFNHVQDAGNKYLTVYGLNHTEFINQYAALCNSDGVCYVTNELKDFLQMYCTAHVMFMDGEGYVEKFGVYALEEAQWLFACGYYVS